MSVDQYPIATLLVSCFATFNGCAATYYVNPLSGNDNNSGHQPTASWRSLERISQTLLEPGDKILLAAGSTFKGQLAFHDLHGSNTAPVIISSYTTDSSGTAQRAIIDAKGHLSGIRLTDSSFVEISNIAIHADAGGTTVNPKKKKKMRCGVLVNTSKPGNYSHIYLDNLSIRDIFFEDPGFRRGNKEVKTANGSQQYGWGIRFINNTPNARMNDIKVTDTKVANVSHTGIKFTSNTNNIHNITIHNNTVLETGGPGIQLSGVFQVHISNNTVDGSGNTNDSRKWGRGSGLWTWSSSDILIEHNRFLNASGPADSAGVHIDFNCRNVVVQYNVSANNAGGFCEILGNNYNNAYRYNISVNDGYRIKGQNGAFQEGKTFWLSGYQGKKKKRSGPFNSYFYNNTIYTNKDIIAKMAVDNATDGLMMINNIFYLQGQSEAVLGDQYNPEKPGASRVKNIVFENNLYLHERNWPTEVLIQDDKPLFGDPQFAHGGGLQREHYIPANHQLIKNTGIDVSKIPGDSVGLAVGLKISHDILGNQITAKPDMGAIELK